MIYLLVDLKIVLAYQNLKSYWEGGGAKPSRGPKPRKYGTSRTYGLDTNEFCYRFKESVKSSTIENKFSER